VTSLLRRPPATGAVARRVAPGAIEARDLGALLQEMARAKERFGLPADAQVVSCYEAGREGRARFLVLRAVCAASGSTASPASCPYRSFTSLESSMSK